jgi:hypothetical protein
MRLGISSVLTLSACLTARADFSYVTTTKSTGGMMAGAMNSVSKNYFKGNKMRADRGDSGTIIDFDAQRVTHIDNKQKTYSVVGFDEVGKNMEGMKQSGAEITIDVKETGQRKNINGFNAHEVILSMDMDSPQARQAGMKMRMEMDLWISPDVPGASDLRSFYQRNAARFPWGALAAGGARQTSQSGLLELQRKMATMNGVPVLQVMRMKSAGDSAQMAQAQDQMAKACAKLEEMKAKGGQQAAMAEQMMTRMNCKAGGSGAGTMFEATIESSEFSTSAIPDSTFAIPAGYKQVERK